MNESAPQSSQLIDGLAKHLFYLSISETIFQFGLKCERWKAEFYAACKALESLAEQGMSSREAFSKAEPIVVEHYKTE